MGIGSNPYERTDYLAITIPAGLILVNLSHA